MFKKINEAFFHAIILVTTVTAFATIKAEVVSTTYYHLDALGSPIAATDENGSLKWRENYRPYGDKIELDMESFENSRWYTGHVHDEETGLAYAGARYYDPVVGRFYSNDPVGFIEQIQRGNSPAHGFNRYAYANNNPYKYIDPDGNLAVDTNTAKNYPKAAKYITNKTITRKSKIAAFKNFGQASQTDVKNAFTPGRGPTVKGSNLVGSNGQFKPNSNSQELEINNQILADFENGVQGAKTLLDSTIEHEATHYFDDQDGVDFPGEEGAAYENSVYGTDIDTNQDAVIYDKAHPNGPP